MPGDVVESDSTCLSNKRTRCYSLNQLISLKVAGRLLIRYLFVFQRSCLISCKRAFILVENPESLRYESSVPPRPAEAPFEFDNTPVITHIGHPCAWPIDSSFSYKHSEQSMCLHLSFPLRYTLFEPWRGMDCLQAEQLTWPISPTEHRASSLSSNRLLLFHEKACWYVPWLQRIRNCSCIWNIPKTLFVWCSETRCRRVLFMTFTVLSYWSRSSGENSNKRSYSRGAGKYNSSRERLRQRESKSKVRLRVAPARLSSFSSNGMLTNLRNIARLWNGRIRRNAKRAPMSSNRFWIGVPVRHHRDLAFSSETALLNVVVCRRIMWPLDQSTYHSVTDFTSSYLRLKRLYTNWVYAKGLLCFQTPPQGCCML